MHLKRIFQLTGWNEDSKPYHYFLLCEDVPADMPLSSSIYEEGTFVGYFLKLMPYEDRGGKRRSTPILIGRLVHHPSAAMIKENQKVTEEWWTWAICIAVGVLFALRFVVKMMPKRSPVQRGIRSSQSDIPEEERVPIETWLDRAEVTQDPPGINSPHDAEVNGSVDGKPLLGDTRPPSESSEPGREP